MITGYSRNIYWVDIYYVLINNYYTYYFFKFSMHREGDCAHRYMYNKAYFQYVQNKKKKLNRAYLDVLVEMNIHYKLQYVLMCSRL